MYLKYNSKSARVQHRNIQMTENDVHIVKMSKRFQEEFEHDELDNTFHVISKSSLSKNLYQNHYYHKESHDYQAQIDLQYRQLYQCENSHCDPNHLNYNCNKNAYEDVYSRNNTPQSVQQSCISNHNHNNNYYNKCGDNFMEEHRTLPTVEYLSDKTIPNSVSEQHYQHYYSYFYNQNPRSPKLSTRSVRSRRLPATLQMSFSNKRLYSTESQFIDHDNYVLKEKIDNNDNENENSYCNLYNMGQIKSGDYLDVKSGFCDSRTDLLNRLQQQKNVCKLRVDLVDLCGNSLNDPMPLGGMVDNEENTNALNTCQQMKGHQMPQLLNDNEITLHRSIKLPATPTKFKVVTPVKKSSPSPKNRRVLIYNTQSPRLSRLSISNIRLQQSKLKQNKESRDVNKSQAIPHISSANKDNEFRIRIPNSISPIKELGKKVCDRIKKNGENKYIDDLNASDNDESSGNDDDGLNNASDFDISSNSNISSDSEEGYKLYAYKLTHSLDVVSTTPSVESSEDSSANPDALLVPSLFPNVPPYLAFSSNSTKGPEVPADLYRILKWRVTNVMPLVVRTILANSGMRLLKKTNDWMGVWGKHMKSPCFKAIRPYQKINHLPGSFKIGRKDSCWKNLAKLMEKHGKKDFGFMPKTYIMPSDLKQLRKSWPKYAQKNVKWIIKPPASARGTGIRVIDKWAQIPKRKPIIVQKYIERPLLINGSKFDLRLYVLVTSINPLRVYMYHNGLARFASVKYSDKSDTLNDRCMHLTNYSINKFSSNYSKNEDVNACHGHKWTIKSLWTYLDSRGVRTELLWAALKSLVLRTILAAENSINNMIKANVESKYSCFELFGFDVLLDADLIPWLLEVNISPSLHSELPLDSHVKAPLVQSVLNTALYNIPPKISIERQREIAVGMSLPPGPICYDKRIYINYLSRTEKIKHNTFTRKNMEDRDEYIDAILDHLTPDDIRCLIIAEDELARCSPLERIFPTVDTYKYLKYTEIPRYYNRLLDAWETRYANNRTEGIHMLRQYCEDRYHLQVPQIPTKKSLNYRTRTMVTFRHAKSAQTIASSSNDLKALRRKIRITHVNNVIQLDVQNFKCNSIYSTQANKDDEETEEKIINEFGGHKHKNTCDDKINTK